MRPVITFILKNLIAIISLGISIYALWKNRKNIDVTWDKNIEENDLDFIFLIDNSAKPHTYHNTYTASIGIVNSSPKDIGFFDLRVFDPKTNINIDFLTKKAVPETIPEKKVFKLIDSQPVRYMQMDIPERTFGTLPANSFTRLDIITVLDILPKQAQELDHISISFKIPQKTFFKRDYFALTNRKKYKFYGISYDITDWKERREKQEQEQQEQAEHEEKKNKE